MAGSFGSKPQRGGPAIDAALAAAFAAGLHNRAEPIHFCLLALHGHSLLLFPLHRLVSFILLGQLFLVNSFLNLFL